MTVIQRSKEGSERLVLSRKLGETICLGEKMFLTVVDIERGKVRLGIEAPRDVPIVRQELLANDDPNGGKPAAPELSTAPE